MLISAESPHLRLLHTILKTCFAVYVVFTSLSEKGLSIAIEEKSSSTKLEADVYVNKEYNHEVFLGNLIKKGTLEFSLIEEYRKMIVMFHEMDTGQDHRLSIQELTVWIHDRIIEHHDQLQKNSSELFKKLDPNGEGFVEWNAYVGMLLGGGYLNGTDTALPDERSKWEKFDQTPGDNKLTYKEFTAFFHPALDPETENFAAAMISDFDTDNSGNISFAEIASPLPTTEPPDPEIAKLDKIFIEEIKQAFRDDLDKNGDGFVTQKELEDYLDPRHLHYAEMEATYLLRVSDIDHDNELSELEMLYNFSLFAKSNLYTEEGS